MSNRNRPKSKKQPFIEIGYSSNLIEPDDSIDFSSEELIALSYSLGNSLSGVERFIDSNPSKDELEEAKEDLRVWTTLKNKIDDYLDSLED